jgi:hypothetical protein
MTPDSATILHESIKPRPLPGPRYTMPPRPGTIDGRCNTAPPPASSLQQILQNDALKRESDTRCCHRPIRPTRI